MNIKSLIITVLIMTINAPLFPGLMQDAKTFRYYSVPAAPEINQDEYHFLVWDCKDLQKEGVRYRVPLHIQNKIIAEYLQRVATPTSARLLTDLQKKNFVL